LVSYFARLGQHLFDTYLIVSIAVLEMCESNIEIQEENLVNELHKCIIVMHSQNLISQPQSCLKIIIQTALSRYVKLDLLVNKSHYNKDGGKIAYYSCPNKNKTKIEPMI
jgi:hypothetical protein